MVLQILSPMSSILADLFLHSTEQAQHLSTLQNNNPPHFFQNWNIANIMASSFHIKNVYTSIPTQVVKLPEKTSLCKTQ
jgi:hypothetical protein